MKEQPCPWRTARQEARTHCYLFKANGFCLAKEHRKIGQLKTWSLVFAGVLSP